MRNEKLETNFDEIYFHSSGDKIVREIGSDLAQQVTRLLEICDRGLFRFYFPASGFVIWDCGLIRSARAPICASDALLQAITPTKSNSNGNFSWVPTSNPRNLCHLTNHVPISWHSMQSLQRQSESHACFHYLVNRFDISLFLGPRQTLSNYQPVTPNMNRNIKNSVDVPIPSTDRSQVRAEHFPRLFSAPPQERRNHKSCRQIGQLTSRFDCDAPLSSLRSHHFSISPSLCGPFSLISLLIPLASRCSHLQFMRVQRFYDSVGSEVLGTCNWARSYKSQHVINDANTKIVIGVQRSRRWCLRTF